MNDTPNLEQYMQRTGTSRDDLLTHLRQMMEIRFFEEKVFDLLGRNIIKGASHLYAGQEAVAVGAVSVLRDDDYITSTHRGHGHCHAHGDSRATNPEAKQDHLNRMMAELCGKQTGYSRGRGGSMHIADVEHGNLGATGIVGGNIPVATGAALSMKMQLPMKMQGEKAGGKDGSGVVLCFFGDGASNTGGFHEAVNMGATWRLPVVYIVENNLYGMSVPFEVACSVSDVADRAVAYSIPGEVVDGMDVLAVREAVGRAVARARAGEGPTLLECKTYRWYGHSRSDPRRYRTREEEAAWKARDPIRQLREKMLEAGLLTEEQFAQLEEQAQQAVETATQFALDSPNPPTEELHRDVYVLSPPSREVIEAECALRERVRGDSATREIRYWEALSEALQEEMDRDERVFIMGEDVGLYGGAYGATRGLFEKYGPERVRDTAISEAAIGGAAVGAAMTGMRPVAEIMYVDFTPLAMDQIANQGAKNRYMFGGRTKVPMVIRTEGGAGRSIAAHHSQSLEALWVHFPGIYVVMPATPYDAKGLLKTCIRDDNPIMFIEHKMLYGTRGPVPQEEYLIPLGVADVKRPGKDVTLVAYSRQVLFALQAAEQLVVEGIEVEVVDLRCLKPLDMATVAESVEKTGRLVVVSEGYRTGGFPGELIARICEEAFFFLDAAPVRVAAADVPVPMSEVLEDATIPQVPDIVRAVRGILS
jgi:2-oxoisovalerate dehydrogenase E1 component